MATHIHTHPPHPHTNTLSNTDRVQLFVEEKSKTRLLLIEDPDTERVECS